MTAAGIETPFPGLRPFQTSESHLFFGRDEQVEALLARLAQRRLLAVVGTSGSGKSSLVRAGLMPALERGYLGPPGTRWIIAVLSRPGIGPFAGLADALADAFQIPAPEILDTLKKSSLGLNEVARKHLNPGEQLIIVVDQFEELFRYRRQTGDRGRVESSAFVKLLLAATGNSDVARGAVSSVAAPLYVVLTMRSDYVGKCAQFRGLPEALNDAQYLVPRIGRDELREAIEGPIALAGAAITEALVERLLNDAGDDPDQLPVLQHALLRIWEQSADGRARGAPLDLPDYEAIGRLETALDKDAEDAFGILAAGADQMIARRMFQRLVEPGSADEETRRPTRLSEIARVCHTGEGSVRAAIEPFRRRGFLNLSADSDPLIDISHESLIRQWKRLKEWVEQEAHAAGTYVRLAQTAAGGGTPYSGPDLVQALEWEKAEDPNEAWAARYNKPGLSWRDAIRFLRRSQRRQQLVRAGIGFLVAAVFAFAIVSWALYRNAASEKRLSDSRRLAATASLMKETRPDLASLLSLEAGKAAETFESRSALFTTAESNLGTLAYLRHTAEVSSVAFSPNGNTLASGSWDGTVRLWDVAARQELGEPLEGHSDTVNGVAFSPDGKMLASASDDSTVRLWDVATHRALGEPLTGHIYNVNSVAFSPDGKVLASASDDHTVRFWDVATHRELGAPLRLPEDEIYSVAFSPDGRTLATADSAFLVRLWDAATRQALGTPLKGHTGSVLGLAFSPDGKTLASASDDQTVRLWDVATKHGLGGPLKGHTASVNSVAFSPHGETLASASDDQTVRLWDVATRQASGEPLRGHTNAVMDVAFSPDGKTLASASDDQTVRLWDLARQHPLGEQLKAHADSVNGVAFSPDRKTLASASSDHTIRLWDVATRKTLGEPLRGHSDSVNAVAFSPDGRTLASASSDHTLRLWDVATRQALGAPLTGHTSLVESVVFSPDGKTLASAGADNTVRLWDAATRQALGEPLRGHRDRANSVAFSSDGKTLASGSSDRTVRLWDVASRRPLGEPIAGSARGVNSVAFSPDGKTLASAGEDHTVRLWSIATRRPVGASMEGHTGTVLGLAFSPDGTILASASLDWTVRLWDVFTRQELGDPLQGHTDRVLSVAFSPDGNTLASGSKDRTVRLWNLNPVSWEARACERANRNLSLIEWQSYIGRDVPYRSTCPKLRPGEGVPAQ